MAEQRGLGSKILGIFVETEPSAATPGEQPEATDDGAQAAQEAQAKSPADLVAELARSVAPAQASPGASSQASAPLSFEDMLSHSGMDPAEIDHVRKAEELLRSLPEGTPLEVQRKIVEASLRAFGFETARILDGTQNQLRALDAYQRVNEQSTAAAIAEAEERIRSLSAQIEDLKGVVDARSRGLAELVQAKAQRQAQLERVLHFFKPASKTPESTS